MRINLAPNTNRPNNIYRARAELKLLLLRPYRQLSLKMQNVKFSTFDIFDINVPPGQNGRGHIDRKYYSPKIIFYECVPVATHWSKHIHRK